MMQLSKKTIFAVADVAPTTKQAKLRVKLKQHPVPRHTSGRLKGQVTTM